MRDVKRVTRTILQKASSALLLLLLCACGGTLFHTFSPLDGEWQRGTAVEFVYGGQEYYNGKCGVRVEARTDVAYRYKDLVVRAEFFDMCDSLIAVDTFALAVYGDEGLRVGSTAGMLYQGGSNILQPDISSRDSLVIRLYHLMPDEMLEGVHDIGVKLVDID